MNKPRLYTVGYTLFSNEKYIDIVRMLKTFNEFNITHLIDVRSIPYSKTYPECNTENLKLISKQFNISYSFMPELGARINSLANVFSKAIDIFFEKIFPISKSNRPDCTELNEDDEIVDFYKLRSNEYFLEGVRKIEIAYDKSYTLVLMCSEKMAINCHRYFLISKEIEKKLGDSIEIEHIVQDENGNIITISNNILNSQLLETVLKRSEIKALDILNSNLLDPAPIDNYFGNTIDEKLNDFCYRYWNLLNGWKK